MGISQLNKLPLNSQGSFTFTIAQKVWRYFIINKLRKWYQLQTHRWCRNLLENGEVIKKTLSGACAPLCRGDLILVCHAKFLISIDMIWSMIWSMIRSVIRSVIRSGPVRSGPVRSGPIQSDPEFVHARWLEGLASFWRATQHGGCLWEKWKWAKPGRSLG